MPLPGQVQPASSYQNRFLQALSLLLAACVSLPILVIILQWGTLGNGEQVI